MYKSISFHKDFPPGEVHLVGSFLMPYTELVKKLGDPTSFLEPGSAIDVEWLIRLPSLNFVTIYNYKDGVAYLGKKKGIPIRKLNDWHIGGKSQEDATEFLRLLENL